MKGMQKIKRGTGFNGVLKYAIENKKGEMEGVIVGGNMLGNTIDKLSREFGVSRRLRNEVEKPVWHNSLRLPKGEQLSYEKLKNIGDSYVKKMGFTDLHQCVYVLHDDPDGQHIHIIASRISLDAKLYLGQNENLKSTRYIQELEKEFNLTVTKGAEYNVGGVVMPKKSRPSKNETEQTIRTGRPSDREVVQVFLDDALRDGPDVSLFIERLNNEGIRVKPAIASTGKMNGFSFRLDDSEIAFTGSKLGKKYAWGAMIKNGLDYDRERDADLLQKVKENFEKYNLVNGELIMSNNEKLKSKNHDAKVFAWRLQSRVLGSPTYRLTLKGRSGSSADVTWVLGNEGREKNSQKKWLHDDEKYFSAKEIEGKISFLMAKNLSGFDIYITPKNRGTDDSHHYILIDDANLDGLRELKKSGFIPVLVQESSKNNIQMIYKVPKIDRADEQELGNSLMRRVNMKFGDKKISGVTHGFRMAGFSNKKPGKGSPFTRIIETNDYVEDSPMSRELQKLRVTADEKKSAKKSLKIIKKGTDFSDDTDAVRRKAKGDADERYVALQRRLEGRGKKVFGDVDHSTIDFNIAKQMFSGGFSRDEIKKSMISHSMHLRANPDYDYEQVERYVDRAVDRSIDRIENDDELGNRLK